MAYTKLNLKNNVLKKGVHYLTSDYKTRNKKRPTHGGMDLIGKLYGKDYIIAIESGKVITSGYSSTAGYYVEIKHDNSYVSRYLHMKKGTLKVSKNDVVKKGDVLGYMGNTGSSKGTHLHFGVKDTKGNNIDPKPYLIGDKNFNNKKTYSGTFPKLPIRGYFQKGDKGENVKLLQNLLNWLTGDDLTIDGVIGDKTIKSVEKWQKMANITIDSKFGKDCLNKAKEYKK